MTMTTCCERLTKSRPAGEKQFCATVGTNSHRKFWKRYTYLSIDLTSQLASSLLAIYNISTECLDLFNIKKPYFGVNFR